MLDHNLERVLRVFDYGPLGRICEMHETDFADEFGMDTFRCGKASKWDEYDPFYAFKNNGSPILAVAHLDTVMRHEARGATFADTADGPVIYSGALDDRLGAYTILELLPALGINVDVLLTTGEESGQSTAQCFEPSGDYHWLIEFDRGGTDVVMYQYEDDETIELVRACGAKVGDGIFSDISYMEHLEIKGFNWGVGYADYHGPRSHAFLIDYWSMLGHFLDFHEDNSGMYLPHEKKATAYDYRSTWGWDSADFDEDEEWREYLRDLDRKADNEVSEDFEEVNRFCLDEQERAQLAD
jgi:hypothetical protein